MLLKFGYHLAWVLVLSLSMMSCQQQQNRSCKDIFRYGKDNKTSQPVGILTVPQDGSDTVELKANLSVPMLLDSSVQVGARLLTSKSDFLAGEPLTYLIYFPPNLPMPTLLGVEVNENYVCSDEMIMNGVPHTIIMTRSVIRLERVQTTGSPETTPPAAGPKATASIGTYATTNSPPYATPPPPPTVTLYPPPTYPPQTYPPQTHLPQTYPPQTYPPQTYPPQTYPPQTYPPQTYPPSVYPPPIYPPPPPHPSYGFGAFPSMPFLAPLYFAFPFPFGFQPYILVIPTPLFGSPFPYFMPNFGYPPSKETFSMSIHGSPNLMANPSTFGNYNPNQFHNPAGNPGFASPPPFPQRPPLPPPVVGGKPSQYPALESRALQRSSEPFGLSFRSPNHYLHPLTPTPFSNSNDPEPEDELVPFALL